MKKMQISGLLLGALALLAAPASAGPTTWSPWFNIAYMDNNDGAQGISFKVKTDGIEFVGANNPSACSNDANKQEIVMRPTAPASARDLMSRTLLSALLAGRQVRVQISGNECIGNRPVFGEVAIR